MADQRSWKEKRRAEAAARDRRADPTGIKARSAWVRGILAFEAAVERRPLKVCGCGVVHATIPASARYLMSNDAAEGFYFECSCRSTLFLPAGDVRRR